MKKNLKKILPAMCAMGVFFACSITAFAGNQPILSLSEESISITHDDESEKIEVEVENWKASKAFVVKYEVDDPSVCKAELESQDHDSFEIKIRSKGTGHTIVKVWLDGYRRSARYIVVDSINYKRDNVKGYSVRHYGYMTGKNGEAASIDDYSIENVDGETRLCVYFTFKDKGLGDGTSAAFSAKFQEEDGDDIKVVSVNVTGIEEGGTGYKMYFRIPHDAAIIKLINDDV